MIVIKHLAVIFFLWISGSALALEYPVIDLSKKSFSDKEVYALKGTWSFYFEEFIDPTTIRPPRTTVSVPGSWNNNLVTGEPLPAKGFGSYGIRVLLPKNRPDIMAIQTTRIKMAHRLYINGQLIQQTGIPSEAGKEPALGHKPNLTLFTLQPEEDEINIVLHVSNFSYTRGGITDPIIIGSPIAVTENRANALVKDFFIAGALVLIALYHLVVWMLRKDDPAPALFSMLCFTIAIGQVVSGQKYIYFYFPNIETELVLRIQFAAALWSAPIYHFFASSIFKDDCIKAINTFAKLVFMLFAAISVLLPINVQVSLLPFQELLILILLTHLIYIGISAFKNKRNGALIFVISVVLAVVTGINDILHERGIIHSVFSTRWAAVFLIFFQGTILTMRASQAFQDLELLKVSLEEKVKDRTSELTELTIENRRLSSHQFQLLELERRSISGDIHDSFNSTLTAVRLCMLTIAEKTKGSALSEETIKQIHQISENCAKQLSDAYERARKMVRNLRPEALDTTGLKGALASYMDGLHTPNGAKFNLHCEGSDKNLSEELSTAIYRVTEEAISNAIKYSLAKNISIDLIVDKEVKLIIQDDGVGFDVMKKKEGHGLINMRERIAGLGGSFELISNPLEGTKITASVPQQKREIR